MPESRSGSNLRQINRWQRDAARAEYLRHPDSSIADVAKATGVAVRTVARARETLVKEGLLAPGRNNTASAADAAALAVAVAGSRPPEPDEPVASETGGQPLTPDKPPAALVDGEALRQMSAMLDDLADEDDEVTRKRMLRQVKKFAFDPTLHPDTRMSASQLWAKLLDMQRAKDLGPGIPTTLEMAINRATDFLRACGPKVAVPAFYRAFDLGEAPTSGQGITQTVEQGEPTPTPAAPAGPSVNDAPVPEQA